MSDLHKEVQNYYGKELQASTDLKTNACCTITPPPAEILKAMLNVHDEVRSKYYGCGLTIPNKLDGLNVLDLGSGSGQDCYILSQLVGEEGFVTGIDMTQEQLDVANKYVDYHCDKFGYKKPNTKFIQGNLDKLSDLDLKKESFDLIVSNCVINLVEDKKAVLKASYDLLKNGAEMYFSDVYADRRVPKELQQDSELWGECLSGALYWNDFLNISKEVGFIDPRVMEVKPIEVGNESLQNKLGEIKFYSVTYRLFKIDGLESDCEDYGQAVRYKGGIKNSENAFSLDDHHFFEKGRIEKVCGNSYLMLNKSRFSEHFDFMGDFSHHYGIFEGCGGNSPFNNLDLNSTDASCC